MVDPLYRQNLLLSPNYKRFMFLHTKLLLQYVFQEMRYKMTSHSDCCFVQVYLNEFTCCVCLWSKCLC